MNKRTFIFPLLIILAIAVLSPIYGNSTVYAQDACYDATGASIPCPPTDAPNGGGNNDSDQGEDTNKNHNSGGGNQNPAAIATPTSTPLPVANPNDGSTEGKKPDDWSHDCKSGSGQLNCILEAAETCQAEGGDSTGTTGSDGTVTIKCTHIEIGPTPFPIALPKDNYLGSCTKENFSRCREQFKCEDGLLVIEVDLYATGGTKYDFYCIPHDSGVLKEFPFASQPSDDGNTDYKYAGVCHFGDGYEQCMSDFFAQCDADGGLYGEIDSGKDATVTTCELPEGMTAEATPMPVAAPSDDGATQGNEDWDESCSWATCWIHDLQCFIDGGSGYAVEDSVGNMGYHCDMPEQKSNSMIPWLGLGLGVVVVALLLPAVQKVREAAARQRSSMRQTKEHILLNKEDPDKKE